jgi:hypothetical protein
MDFLSAKWRMIQNKELTIIYTVDYLLWCINRGIEMMLLRLGKQEMFSQFLREFSYFTDRKEDV